MIKVAIQGVAGCFHDIAARKYFEGQKVETVPCETFQSLFETLKQDPAMLGAVAIENTIAGSLLQNHNLLHESGLKIVGEQKLRIVQNLCALPGQTIADIKEAASHPIALAQCAAFLDANRHIKAVESDDTALSAKEIAEEGPKAKGKAAICSDLAADIYGLEVLAASIETNKRNYTRFLIVADSWIANDFTKGKNIDKSSLVFTLPHEEGSLAKVLSILSYYNMNLTKIQSLPILGREWEYQFYIDLSFTNIIKYKQAIEAITPLTKDLLILGEYEDGLQR